MEDLSAKSLAALAGVINQSRLAADGPPNIPPYTLESMRSAVQANQVYLPTVYQQGYCKPLNDVLSELKTNPAPVMMQVGIDAVAQHAPDSPVLPELKRLLIVIADLYNTFVDAVSRAQVNISLSERLPPLASFMSSASSGPFTITSDTVRQFMASDVAVVSLPSAFRDHPLIWSSLSHETGGHDVIHADKGLLSEMQVSVYQQLADNELPGNHPSHEQKMGLLWAYWMDETSADVYGLLNMGPSYILGALPFFSAFLSQLGSDIEVPHIRTNSAAVQGKLDPHPTDILRIGVAQGVLSAMTSLKETTKQRYIKLLDEVTAIVAPDVSHINLSGDLTLVAGGRTFNANVAGQYPVQPMLSTAREVGAHIARAPFTRLASKSIQAIVTWDNNNESLAVDLAEQLLSDQPIDNQTRPIMVLAGGILAAARQPQKYHDLNRKVEQSLDRVIAISPIWS